MNIGKGNIVTVTSRYNESATGEVMRIRGNIVTIYINRNGWNRAEDWHISKVKVAS